MLRERVELDVARVAPPGVRTLVGNVFALEDLPPDRCDAIVVCLPGGGMTRRYFDLDVAGASGAFSMARSLAGERLVVVTLDLPGTGESDAPADGYSLTPDAVADVVAEAVAQLTAALHAGTLVHDLPAVPDAPLVGLGHSAGALITCYVQAHHRPYTRLVLLGFAGRGLVDYLSDEERAFIGDGQGLRGQLDRLVAARFGEPRPRSQTSSSDLLVRVPLTDDVREELASCGTCLLGAVGLVSMIPGASAAELEAIDVPVFLGVGDDDITGKPEHIPADFPNASDVTLFVLEDSGHNHNVAPRRQQLWDRIATWISSTR